ncbi:hypothetical protein [Halovivax gelatinilyticus]|uniref:hypothetical protein n=1 Tax=Halovivax gelatinilyticus TaxID=2961597 RepID=UPI0020CA4A2D|nr:hypothetical protein [Halovivax gelatinilyticus]
MSVLLTAIAFVLGVFLLMWGILSIVDPERAFRYENIFQIRDVELSGFGVAIQQISGVFLLFATPFVVGRAMADPLAIPLMYVVALAPFVRWYDVGPDWLVGFVR